MGPHNYAQLNFNKGAKAIQWEIENAFSTNATGAIRHLTQKTNLDLNLATYTEINLKWIMFLKVKLKTITIF